MADSREIQKQAIKSIESIILNFVNILFSEKAKRLILKKSDDVTQLQLEFSCKKYPKLAYNMCTLAQVYRLLSSDLESTKRDLYYEHKLLYKHQVNLDRSISAVCELLGERRTNLNIVSSSKGLIAGSITFMNNEGLLIDCRIKPVLIVESLIGFRILSTAQYIIVVEKDATFQKILDERFSDILPDALLVTGKGYPDICTRNFLKWVVSELKCPIYGLFDADPHGMEIMLTYKYGSMQDKMEGKGAFISNMKWIGMKPTDGKLFNVADNQYLPLSHRDYKKLIRLRRRAIILKEFEVAEEVDYIRELQKKLELEAISSISPEFLVRNLIMPRVNPSMLD